jgi:peptidyl-prolyl cis-trans isomerase A (cyclophilin A)
MTFTRILAFAGALTLATTVQAKPFAVFHTSAGNFTVELLPDKAPKTVENFVGLATGSQTWQHPGTRQEMKNKPLYDGTVFHRTIPNFMIQGGDPLGRGVGGPGYQFQDEFSDLKFDNAGILAMANSGPNTNGSQFFVTVAPTPHLTNKHTIFGRVVDGMDVVYKISEMPTQGDRPANPVKLIKVEIRDTQSGGPAKETGQTDKSTTGGAVSGDQ